MDGILVIDKPKGPTSHDICQIIKRDLGVKKVGHTGTLDPMATGVLVILLDGATKLQSLFLKKDKVYQFTMKLGETTDTYDAEGVVVRTRDVIPAKAGIQNIENILSKFRGTIFQKPPPYSAIKKQGQPLYKLARKGIAVEIPPREVTIYSLETKEVALPFVRMEVHCSSGTYVRSIAHDIGEALGCGAHVTELRRLRAEPFGIEDARPL